ncbi:MAG: undecaprenyldiphospho-muramoylpentapeptide beta-N-acetylglucosaminyltransferase [Armatimonadetes bacterium]|nr:undecaprenyldiphospho-muramoylpentapeptide beta-N-acetylglucosaminyltransferase [Armatimonadota bacterium]
MRLIVTGGGTGGHVYPALEIARLARADGHDVRYLGSIRGQEGQACRDAGIEFVGFRVGPLRSLWTPAGLKDAWRTVRATGAARRELAGWGADKVFSTGGFGSGPALLAARSLRIPVVLLEQNTIPGRTHRIAGRYAETVCLVFEEAAENFQGRTVRTGMPLRAPLLRRASEAAHSRRDAGVFTLCFGGSQGAAALNEAVLTVALRVGAAGNRWLQVSGPKLYDSTVKAAERLCRASTHEIRPFLDAGQMAEALARTDVAVARAGAGTISELALFGVPAIFVPYPYAHAGHQYHNARVIEKLGAATIIRQSELTPEKLEAVWREWTEDETRRSVAANALRRWSAPDAGKRIMETLNGIPDADKSRD